MRPHCLESDALGRQLPVHTQPFAFRAPEEDDESVKMSNTTHGRSSAVHAADDANSIVILPAPSGFCEGRPAPLPQAGPAAAGISPSFSVTSAFLSVLCVKSFAFLSAACPQSRQFLFDTNEPLPNFATHTKQTTSISLCDASQYLSRTANLAIHTKQTTSLQITSFFLFNTNELLPITDRQSQVTSHQLLITNHYSTLTNTRSTP